MKQINCTFLFLPLRIPLEVYEGRWVGRVPNQIQLESVMISYQEMEVNKKPHEFQFDPVPDHRSSAPPPSPHVPRAVEASPRGNGRQTTTQMVLSIFHSPLAQEQENRAGGQPSRTHHITVTGESDFFSSPPPPPPPSPLLLPLPVTAFRQSYCE